MFLVHTDSLSLFNGQYDFTYDEKEAEWYERQEDATADVSLLCSNQGYSSDELETMTEEEYRLAMIDTRRLVWENV